jgi:hypothetical protein
MRKQLVLLAGLLLWPVLASADYQHAGFDPDNPFWLGVGVGGGKLQSTAPAPAAARETFSFSIDVGARITRDWGLGLEYGLVMPEGGCGGHSCTPQRNDFAPNFSHWFLIAEHRPPDSGVRLRAGVGVSSMCYRYYKSRGNFWEEFVEAVVFGDDNVDPNSTHWDCKSLHALGGSVAVGYQWPISEGEGSIGLQLRGEAAEFAASSKAGTPRFKHRAVMLQIHLDIN